MSLCGITVLYVAWRDKNTKTDVKVTALEVCIGCTEGVYCSDRVDNK